MKWRDIPQFPHCTYRVNVSWKFLEDHIRDTMKSLELVETQPDFQRGYVWSRQQQIDYVEYILRGGRYGRDLIWNCASWSGKYSTDDDEPLVLVDGQQRLGAVRAFMDDKILAFGTKYSDFEGTIRGAGTGPDFIFQVFELQTEREVLEFYLALNTGGSVHTGQDLMPALEKLARLNQNHKQRSCSQEREQNERR